MTYEHRGGKENSLTFTIWEVDIRPIVWQQSQQLSTSDLSLSDDWNVRGDCLPSATAGQSQICGPRVLENQPRPSLASAHWLWWEVNIWAHWDWAPRRHKLWPGQPGELEPGNPPLCFIHNNVPTFVNLTLKLTFWQAESINLLYICWGIWGVRKTHLARDPLRCVPSAGHWSLLSSLLSAPGPVSLMTLLVTSQWMASFLSNSLSPVLVIPRGPQSYRTKQFVFASDPGLKGYTYIILFDIFVSLQNLLRSIRREIVILLRCLYSKLKIRI